MCELWCHLELGTIGMMPEDVKERGLTYGMGAETPGYQQGARRSAAVRVGPALSPGVSEESASGTAEMAHVRLGMSPRRPARGDALKGPRDLEGMTQ